MDADLHTHILALAAVAAGAGILAGACLRGASAGPRVDAIAGLFGAAILQYACAAAGLEAASGAMRADLGGLAGHGALGLLGGGALLMLTRAGGRRAETPAA